MFIYGKQAAHVVRIVTRATGVITTLAGTGVSSYANASGPALSATLRSPSGVAVDAYGSVFISESVS